MEVTRHAQEDAQIQAQDSKKGQVIWKTPILQEVPSKALGVASPLSSSDTYSVLKEKSRFGFNRFGAGNRIDEIRKRSFRFPSTILPGSLPESGSLEEL